MSRAFAIVLLSLIFGMLIFGCASPSQASGNQGTTVGGNSQGTGIATDKVVLTGPVVLPEGKVGKPYEYSYCNPKPADKLGLCGGINPNNNPRGGKGPYSFYLGSGTGFPPFGLSLNLNGILSGIPTAAGERTFEVCAKDIGGDYDCESYTMTIVEDTGVAGIWELTADSLMNGPEGSFPAGCQMEQKFQLNITQNGNVIGGVATNRLTKTTGCGIWSVEIKTADKMQISGVLSAPSATFSVGNTDFIGALRSGNMTGTMATCHSPDTRCTKSGLQQLNWYAGNFTAIRAN